MYQDQDTDTELEPEEEGRPQPMAGFRLSVVSSTKRKMEVEEETGVVMRRTVSAPPVLTPMSQLMEGSSLQPKEDSGRVFFPVSVDLESLVDWKEVTECRGREENNNYESLRKAALVTVNNKDVAVFKYGDDVIATSSRCPHAGGPLHLADIEVLPDRSLCLRCPWHRWAFRLGPGTPGDCVFPPGREEKKLQVYPTARQAGKKHIKIGFDSFDTFNLINETF